MVYYSVWQATGRPTNQINRVHCLSSMLLVTSAGYQSTAQGRAWGRVGAELQVPPIFPIVPSEEPPISFPLAKAKRSRRETNRVNRGKPSPLELHCEPITQASNSGPAHSVIISGPRSSINFWLENTNDYQTWPVGPVSYMALHCQD